ncbi:MULTISPECIES: hypothetical protein [Streptomyces]|nr:MULTISPECIES: hypothetical protein [unclassified Streptomyces]WUD88264.1 hypothetical protein OG703_08945 [Streptomyces anulatus]
MPLDLSFTCLGDNCIPLPPLFGLAPFLLLLPTFGRYDDLFEIA